MMATQTDSTGCCCWWCCDFHLNEDNARFFLLASLMVVYMTFGAAIFSAIEHPVEMQNHQKWNKTFFNFSQRFNISPGEFRRFLKEYEMAMAAGVRMDTLRPRWDFTGAFYFVGTVVSTIGFGMTTPATATGKIFLIFYGMVGCAGTILFFNLFLERIITLLAVTMRAFQIHQLKVKGVFPEPSQGKNKLNEELYNLMSWKPSVYNVMLILGIAAIIISCCASAMYSPAEGWNYIDSLYFCFVTFSTIGFGDLVSGQRQSYDAQGYGFGNFIFILLGVCCIYSLFNVISIVIKQFLNWLLQCFTCNRRARLSHKHLRRRHCIAAAPLSDGRPLRSEVSMDTEAVYESETDARRMSVEMSVIRDFLAASASVPHRVADAAIQKTQGLESGNRHHHKVAWSDTQNGFGPATVTNNKLGETVDHDLQKGLLSDIGSLAVMNNKLAETSDSCHSGVHVGINLSSVRNSRLLENSDHSHQHKLPSSHATPTSEHKGCSTLSNTPDPLRDKLEETSDHSGHACSSGVGSLANVNESLVPTSGGDSQNGLSSGIGSLSILNKFADVSDVNEQRLCHDGYFSHFTEAILQEPNHPVHTRTEDLESSKCSDSSHRRMKSEQLSSTKNRTVMHSGSTDCIKDCSGDTDSIASRKSWTHHCADNSDVALLRNIGSLAVMNNRFAETSQKNFKKHFGVSGNTENT
ncbi:potassium channel subfamily K member 13-like [Protopterus annectens]|uniref:potassium channel subfamily K member 13-like n=1 Tax=Protopterus annectens TaxID=7888 RepID=UPI001CF9A4BB|nr:potassium channel subfamily K member 13-like [Protopterus annectens]